MCICHNMNEVTQTHIADFLDYLKHVRRYSAHTLKSYETDLGQFVDYVMLHYTSLSLAEINHLIIRSWMMQMVEQKLTAKTINRKISALRSFYNYLKKIGVVEKNPTLKIVTPKIPKRLPSYVQESNIKKLFDKVGSQDFASIRDALIIEMFYATGIRRSELINLRDNDIDYANRAMKVIGKGNKERIIPLSDMTLKNIAIYIESRNEMLDSKESDTLFITKKGKKLYPKYVYNLVKRYLSQVTSISKRSPHVLRHSFATHLMNGGADLNAVKELLGHANLAATQVYTHNSIEKLKETYKRAHPKSEK